MKIRFYSVSALIVSFFSIFLLICDVPTPPPGADQADVKLILKSSTGVEGTTVISDTVGNLLSIGIILQLTQHIDSAEIIVLNGDSIEYRFHANSKKTDVDTVFFPALFPTSGDRLILATGFINGADKIELSATIHVLDRPDINHAPELTVEGWDLVMAGDTVVLTTTATDPNDGQTVTITATRLPEGATFKDDSLVWATTLDDTGTDTAIFIAQDNGDPSLADTDTVIITVSADPVNRPPALVITGRRIVTAGDEMVLAVTATDPDSGQTVTIEATRLPDGATFENDTIRWTPEEDDIGSEIIVVTATDDGDPVRSSEETVEIIVTETPVNEPPKWNSDTLRLSGMTGEALSRSLAELCSDPDGDPLVFTLLSGGPEGDAITEGTWSFTPSKDDVGTFTLIIVAADPYNGTDTLIVKLTVDSAGVEDTKSPALRLVTPSSDSATTSASSYEVTVSCTDESGIAQVLCSMGEREFTVTNSSDTLYSAMITDLVASEWNTIRFIGIDNSPAANQCTLYVSIKSDPEAPDVTPPSITLRVPSKDTTIAEGSLEMSVRCTDPESGIAQVTIGGQTAQEVQTDIYSTMVTGLTAEQYTTVTITATDAATAPNTDSVSVRIYYDNDVTGPDITLGTPSDDSVSTNSASYSVTLTCTDGSGVSSVNGAMNGTTFNGVRGSGDNWDITIEGLSEGVYNEIVFTATDSSLRANTSEKTIYIEYDPTMDDVDGPTIAQRSGPESDDIVSDPVVEIIDTIYDPSGIESVTWTLNDGATQDMEPVTGAPGRYSLSTTLPSAGTYTIEVTATDNSSQHHTSTQTIALQYVVAPQITDQSLSNDYCPGEEVTVSVSATGTLPLQYQWSDEGGEISGADGPEYTISSVTATTTLTCEVSNGAEESATSDPIVITVNTPPSISNPSNTTVCEGGSTTMSVTSNGVSFQWYRGTPNGSYSTVNNNANYSGATSSTLTFNNTSSSMADSYYCIATSNGCSDTSGIAALSLSFASTQPTLSADKTQVCPGDDVVLSITAGQLGDGAEWRWYRDGSSVAFGTGTPITVNPQTQTAYRARGVGDCGNGPLSDEITVSVNSLSTSPTGINAASNPVCPGSPVKLTVIGGSLGTGASWKWYTDAACSIPASGTLGGTNGSELTVSITSPVTYRVRAEGGCNGETGPASLPVSVITPISISGPSSITGCDLLWSRFSVTASGGGTGTLNYQWNFRGDPISDNQNYQNTNTRELSVRASVITEGDYSCTVDNGYDCSETSAVATLTVNTSPLTVSPPSPSNWNVCVGSPYIGFDVTVSGGSGNYTYQWYKDDVPIEEDLSRSIDPTQRTIYVTDLQTSDAGKYNCRVNDEDNLGCPLISDYGTVTVDDVCP